MHGSALTAIAPQAAAGFGKPLLQTVDNEGNIGSDCFASQTGFRKQTKKPHFPPLPPDILLPQATYRCLVLTNLFLWFPALTHHLPMRHQFPSLPQLCSEASSTHPEMGGQGTPPPQTQFQWEIAPILLHAVLKDTN